jgi:transposase
MFIVGVDIAKRAHEAIIIDGNGTVIQKPFSFKNTSQGFEEFF